MPHTRPPRKVKLITCRALSHILSPMIHPLSRKVVLDISLHLNPDRLRDRLNHEIKQMEEPGEEIILGYGMCGRGVQGICSDKGRLILPRVDDCVGAVLGSRARHKSILAENTGCFFLEPKWIGTEMDVFTQCLKGLDLIPEEYRDEILKTVLRHYTKLALLTHEGQKFPSAVARCQKLARDHHLEFVQYKSDLGLLTNLTTGRWTEEQFVMTSPGQKVPYF